MKNLIFLALTSAVLFGCDGNVTDFVKGAGNPASLSPIVAPIPGSMGPVGFKVSPGHVKATSTDMSMEATVTPTNRILTSSDSTMSMVVTVGRGPVSVQ